MAAGHPTRRIDANMSRDRLRGQRCADGLERTRRVYFLPRLPGGRMGGVVTRSRRRGYTATERRACHERLIRGQRATRLIKPDGDFYSVEGYTPQEVVISEGGALTFAPNGDHCDGAFPSIA